MALWKIAETREELYAMLGTRFSDEGLNRHDNLHWLASRVLLSRLFPNDQAELRKDPFNKPSLWVNGLAYHVSISHSYEYAVVVVSALQQVAVDLEKVDDRVVRVSHKFIRDDEAIDDLHLQVLSYTVIWSSKETLYKYYGKKELDFKQHLRIEPFIISAGDRFTIKGHIQKEEYHSMLQIEVIRMGEYILTYIV